MNDPQLQGFLREQQKAAHALNAASDVVTLVPLPRGFHALDTLGGLLQLLGAPVALDAEPGLGPETEEPPTHYLARFSCGGLVRNPDGSVRTASDWLVGIRFSDDYLRRVRPFEVVTFIGPESVWHPNIAGRKHAICIGNVTAGTALLDLVYQVWEIVSWNRFRLDDCLDPAAAAWARDPANRSRFPVDTRPLKRRAPPAQASEVSA